ncbi:uncharacterized protein BX664DRAFT_319310 [Halteromyces radiatus]|uniref:uncharacterized protein n=1 Tax=Halteromyces radiatus TaxID=101107 RepID=UPI00221FDFCE|nr:uncharacterized protein BX664DRAFT_319310 [Halteromyces radiatus]KAI8098669.1 hypothetical protein BX664DRAFT_319310 [Halteromyces radiatus]
MPKLISLASKWTPEQQNLFRTSITGLAQVNIDDDATFLSSDLEEISRTTGLPLQVLIALRQHIVSEMMISSFHPNIMVNYISSHFDPLDRLLGGGMRIGDMTELLSEHPHLLEKLMVQFMQGFLNHCPDAHICHVDTNGSFQTRILHYTKVMSLSRIECHKAFTVPKINQIMDRYGALQLASQQVKDKPMLIVIQDIGYLMDSDWNVTLDQVKKLEDTILQLKLMNITILVSHHLVPTTPRRYELTLDNIVDLRLNLSSNHQDLHIDITKARHVKTPQSCSVSM